MRKAISILIGVLWLSLSSSLVQADGMILPLPDEALAPSYVAVRSHHVTVRIEDNHAVTWVEQEFYNPYDAPVRGRYLFPVPPEAILSRFEAIVDGQRQAIVHQDAETTNGALYATVGQQHDPSLLQYAGWESVAFDLDLAPGESRAVRLEYEQVLAPQGGLIHYRYVLSTERYSSLPLEAVSVTVDVRSSGSLASLYSPSHDVAVEHLGAGRARLSWEAGNVTPAEDFELFFAPAESGFGGGLLTGRREESDHLLFLFSPDSELRPGDALAKDIVFVIDRSGSMSGEKIEQARNALHFILGQLGEQDRFSIVSFDDRILVLDEILRPVDAQSLADARRMVDRLTADGSTDLEAAVQTGLEILDRSESRGASRLVVFLTDGLPTAGITDGDAIARLVSGSNAHLEARLHVFGVGYDVNTHLLDRLAADNGGTVTYVQPGENLELALTEFYGKIAHPVLTELEVEFEGLEASDLYPQVLPDLFQGSSLMLTARYRAQGHQVSVRVRGRAGSELREYVYRFDLDETGGRDFVPRLWATRRVGALLDRIRVEGESAAAVDEIRELGLGYGIVTPYTSFVIEGQSAGAASTANMALYSRTDLNSVSGETTVQARVQNQMYQEAVQANLATGANVTNVGQRSMALVGARQVDLALLRGQGSGDEANPSEWLEQSIKADRTVIFGSEAYFALAADPEVRPFLQSGPNVVFAYRGEVIAIDDPGYGPQPEIQAPARMDTGDVRRDAGGTGPRSAAPDSGAARLLLGVALWVASLAGAAMLVGGVALVLVVRRGRSVAR